MDSLSLVKKVKFGNSLEKIYSETIRNNQIIEEYTTGSNKVHYVLIQHENVISRPWLRACLPILPLLESQLSSPQVNIAPPPPCKYDTPTYQNTTISAEHTPYEFLIWLFNILQKLYRVQQFGYLIY